MGRLQRPGPWPVEQREDLARAGVDTLWQRVRSFVVLSSSLALLMTAVALEIAPQEVSRTAQDSLLLFLLLRLPVAVFVAFLVQYLLSRVGLGAWEKLELLDASGEGASVLAWVKRAGVATACVLLPPLLLWRPEGRWLWEAASETILAHPSGIRDDELLAMTAALDEDI